jgi:23S rRNA (uridine2552-2'-O)-methyltransferase
MAKEKGYRTRSAFKLLEIQEKFKIIGKGDVVLDLGAAPGGWSQVASQLTTRPVIAVDILDISPLQNVRIIRGDFMDQSTLDQIINIIDEEPGIDVILSDMCPNTCGIKKIDHMRIVNILEEVIQFSKGNLRGGGSLVVKVFQGGAEKDALNDIKKCFRKVSHFKPKSSRNQSSEIYLIANGFKNAP